MKQQLIELRDLVSKMRVAQNEFSRSKSAASMIKKSSLEREVDWILTKNPFKEIVNDTE